MEEQQLIMQNVRQKIFLSKMSNVKALIMPLAKNPSKRYDYREIPIITGLKGGTCSTAIADAKILGTVKNGKGLGVSDEGVLFLENDNFEYQKKLVLKKVTFFREMYEQGINSVAQARQFLEPRLKEGNYKSTTLHNFAQAAARRYAELILNQNIGRGRRVVRRRPREKEQLVAVSKEKMPINDYADDLLLIKNLKKKYEGQWEKILKIIE